MCVCVLVASVRVLIERMYERWLSLHMSDG